MKTNAQDMTEGRTLKTQEWVAEVSTPLVVEGSSIPLLLMVASLVEAFPVDLEAASPAAVAVMNFIFDWKSLIPDIFLGESYILDFLKGPQL